MQLIAFIYDPFEFNMVTYIVTYPDGDIHTRMNFFLFNYVFLSISPFITSNICLNIFFDFIFFNFLTCKENVNQSHKRKQFFRIQKITFNVCILSMVFNVDFSLCYPLAFSKFPMGDKKPFDWNYREFRRK